MCYPKPGPRCSAHAEVALSRAYHRYEEVEYSPRVSAAEKLALREAWTKAELEYDMTPRGQEELQKAINRKMGNPQKYIDRLERGKALRALALQQIKEQDKGDQGVHTAHEERCSRISSAEGFPAEQVMVALKTLTTKHGEPIGEGRSRFVFDAGNGEVVKLPKNWEGISASGNEATWKMHDTVPVAKCRIEMVDDIEVLYMEKVSPVKSSQGLPEWTSWVDCQQVGIDKEGKLVAYDL